MPVPCCLDAKVGWTAATEVRNFWLCMGRVSVHIWYDFIHGYKELTSPSKRQPGRGFLFLRAFAPSVEDGTSCGLLIRLLIESCRGWTIDWPQVLDQGFENLFSELAFYGIALVSTFFMCHPVALVCLLVLAAKSEGFILMHLFLSWQRAMQEMSTEDQTRRWIVRNGGVFCISLLVGSICRMLIW